MITHSEQDDWSSSYLRDHDKKTAIGGIDPSKRCVLEGRNHAVEHEHTRAKHGPLDAFSFTQL